MNLNSNGTFGSRARRLTRRLSYGISKALSWKSGTTSDIQLYLKDKKFSLISSSFYC